MQLKEMEKAVAAYAESKEVYVQPATYARAHGELDIYRASNRLNCECAKAVTGAIKEHWDGSRVNPAGAKAVIEQYGEKRVNIILANTVCQMSGDARFSRSNREWAEALPKLERGDEWPIDAHPVKLDSFIDAARREIMERNNPGRAEDKAPARRESATAKIVPIYAFPLEFAKENGEIEAWRESMEANQACLRDIDKAVHDSYLGEYRYDLKAAAKTVIDAHGFERLNHVLANILLNCHYDGRYSGGNKEWARNFGIVPDRHIYCNTHPAILDGFIDRARKAHRDVLAAAKDNAPARRESMAATLEAAKQAVREASAKATAETNAKEKKYGPAIG